MDKSLTSLSDDEVLLFSHDQTFKVGKVKLAINNFLNRLPEIFRKSLSSYHINVSYYDSKGQIINNGGVWLLERGISCEVLKMRASGWQKGKIKVCISVDFYPDPSESDDGLLANNSLESNLESPLEEIRQTINKETN
jgi:hypothetical protein